MKRRALLTASGSALLAGCNTPTRTTTDNTTEATTQQSTRSDQIPVIVTVNETGLQDAGLEVELTVDKRATEYQPAQLRTTLRNSSDSVLEIEFTGPAPLGEAVFASNEKLFLAPARQDYADKSANNVSSGYVNETRDAPCWQAIEEIIIENRTGAYRLHPREAVSNVHNLIAFTGDDCPHEGEYTFTEPDLRYRTQGSDDISSLRWGFTLYYPGAIA